MNWADSAREFDSYLRLRTFPLAFKLFASADALDKVGGIRRLDYKPRMCQLITLARVHGWTLGATADELGSPVCASIIGLREPPQELMAGKTLAGIMYKTARDAKEHEKAVPRLASGKYKALAIAPLKNNKFEPDIVLGYGNPAQIFMLVAALQWQDFEMVMALPAASVDKALSGLKGLHQGGIRYPIPSWGAQVQAPSLLQKEATEES
jgi:uncharacterized protein (DUF169 family)